MVWINHDMAFLALLPSIGPTVAAGPLSLALATLKFTKQTFTALIGSFL